VDIVTFYQNTLTAQNNWYKMDVSQLDCLCDIYFKESQRKKQIFNSMQWHLLWQPAAQ